MRSIRFEHVSFHVALALLMLLCGAASRVYADTDEAPTVESQDLRLVLYTDLNGIANLIDNALRHGRGEVAVRASEYADNVELRVVDRGPGLPRNAVEQLFAPFQRLGDRDNVPGLGLGLSVVKGFVEAMGGVVTAEDTPGGGLTMVVSLPVARP